MVVHPGEKCIRHSEANCFSSQSWGNRLSARVPASRRVVLSTLNHPKDLRDVGRFHWEMTVLGRFVRATSLCRAFRRADSVFFGGAFTESYFLKTISDDERQGFICTDDPARYVSILLALRRLEKERIQGAMAEVGVYRGYTSRVLHRLAPNRRLYLFDTFEGFPTSDLEGRIDDRFRDTSVELVSKVVGDLENVVIRKGYFPETAKGLEKESFALVMLDSDLYEPTLAGLELFYDRLNPGGYMFLHDYNNPESDHAVSRAFDEFMKDKPETPVDIADSMGSILFRKLRK